MGYGRRDFNDIHIFDLDGMSWKKSPPVRGKAPEARQWPHQLRASLLMLVAEDGTAKTALMTFTS